MWRTRDLLYRLSRGDECVVGPDEALELLMFLDQVNSRLAVLETFQAHISAVANHLETCLDAEISERKEESTRRWMQESI